MGGGLARVQFFCLGVFRIVVFINLQYIFPTDDDQGAVNIHAQHFVHGHQLPLAHAAGLPVLWGVIRDAPSAKLLGLAGDGDTRLAGAVGNKFGGQGVGAAQK